MRRDLAHINEQLLIERLALGDPAAKEWLYDKYAGALYSIALQLVVTETKAADVIVRVYNWAFHHIGSFHTSGHHSLFTWLMRKTREYAIQEMIPDSALTGAELIKQEEGILQKFYLLLPTDQQQVFRLSFFKGLSVATIARIMAQPDEQINETLKEAMRSFRQYLKSNWN
ncbi:RNA polymerase sigma factor, sigma-70 family [Chitinophaga terrae (ex Kim and Jung 2007)]|uniref:RNA polymerase sigma factor, sigma-70 family n=1 Tax=Chitinophaga terrae (ex Kim and Jung 2007) TaxID=408074 RepID=A0A1H4G704_9BACT|nr:sigma-70 family RNA polymerase sigma factor [Chitinophaga terrae (ex Kim and Jung 2007)]SEB05375.1 RNA polymerase sigma factor, sigma-70 family [Chitinophaga terrae (ex Kim and Jung 2007)]